MAGGISFEAALFPATFSFDLGRVASSPGRLRVRSRQALSRRRDIVQLVIKTGTNTGVVDCY